jgi:hypothetical protein
MAYKDQGFHFDYPMILYHCNDLLPPNNYPHNMDTLTVSSYKM